MIKDEALKMAIEWIERWHGVSPSKTKTLAKCYKALECQDKIENSDFNKYSKQELFEYIIFLRTAIDGQLETKWISVDELLPPINSEVMTWGAGTANNSFGYLQAWYTEKGWQELDSCGDFFNDLPPTHWIPLSSYKVPSKDD